MADIEALDGVAAGSIEAVNGVAKADIQAINGCGVPASGATLWCIVGADGAVATAAASNLNAWTGYVSADMGTSDYNEVAYGKDGAGAGLWVAVNQKTDRDIRYSSDPTAGVDAWSNVDPDVNMGGVAWGNNVWVAVGGSGKMYRSTDGASWTNITSDLAGDVSEWTDSVGLKDVTSDGAGNWICTQSDRVFYSSDEAVTWELGEAWDDGYTAYSCGFTNGKWIVFRRKSGHTRIVTSSNGTTWAAEVQTGTGTKGIGNTAVKMAAGGGTVIIVNANDISRSTDTGATFTKTDNTLGFGNARGINTDGNGNWIVVHDDGQVSINTSDGAPGSWVGQTGAQDGGSATDLRFPTGGANVLDLDSVAANVYLPV